MKKGLYAIRDTVAQSLTGNVHSVFVFGHDAAAIRFFSDAASDMQGIGRHAADYELIRLGTLDEDTGYIEVPDVPLNPFPQVVLTGAQLRASQEAAKALADAAEARR